MPELLTLKAASERFSIPASTLRAWIRYGRLTGYDKTLGKSRPKWLVRASEVIGLLEQHKSQPTLRRSRKSPERKILTDEVLRKWGIVA